MFAPTSTLADLSRSLLRIPMAGPGDREPIAPQRSTRGRVPRARAGARRASENQTVALAVRGQVPRVGAGARGAGKPATLPRVADPWWASELLRRRAELAAFLEARAGLNPL